VGGQRLHCSCSGYRCVWLPFGSCYKDGVFELSRRVSNMVPSTSGVLISVSGVTPDSQPRGDEGDRSLSSLQTAAKPAPAVDSLRLCPGGIRGGAGGTRRGYVERSLIVWRSVSAACR
jgi:hypothetical protein